MLLPAKELHKKLGPWFKHAQRDMPWRKTADPYAIWLSETMLQQTQVETVKPYWQRFLAKFPRVHDLAAADLQQVLALWAGLGYYRRARHLHEAAKQIVQQHGGSLPASVEALLKLPGIGRYTAAAVASIAFNIPAPVVDGNVMRVLSRLTGYDRNIADPGNTPFFWHLAGEILEGAGKAARGGAPPRYGDINQALMELGATVCTPSQPACLLCPVGAFCRALAEGRQEKLPVREKRAKTPVVRGVALVITRSSKADGGGCEVLLMQRPAGGLWSEMWEFPVLPVDAVDGAGENRRAQWKKLVRQRLGLHVTRMVLCGEVRHQLTHRECVYQVAVCRVKQGCAEPHLPACIGSSKETAVARYVARHWAPWPIARRGGLPVARLVHKIAEKCGM